jgi:hypothetical protein
MAGVTVQFQPFKPFKSFKPFETPEILSWGLSLRSRVSVPGSAKEVAS